MSNDITAIQPIEYREQRVLTTKQLAEGYQVDPKIIRKNFSRNKTRYFEGEDYFFLDGEALRSFKDRIPSNLLGYSIEDDASEDLDNRASNWGSVENNRASNLRSVGNRTKTLILWTEYGALLHAKSLNSDAAWMVFKRLRDTYFRVHGGRAKIAEPATPSALWQEAFLRLEGRLTGLEAEVKALRSQAGVRGDNAAAQTLFEIMESANKGALGDLSRMFQNAPVYRSKEERKPSHE